MAKRNLYVTYRDGRLALCDEQTGEPIAEVGALKFEQREGMEWAHAIINAPFRLPPPDDPAT